MDIISLSLLLGLIVVSDHILNGQFKISHKLLNWLDEPTKDFKRQDQSNSKPQRPTE
ncbi:hypothetical protein M595_4461 [Lyngbya aestuarii BL J]|uniref:Uncharacterized protein n=1 Tax=Lyngbya aestuarii BL J TaxID=1348334 RepID=U7QCI1_9CYAN|nr:hypothetical protein M595_4461 [Lyngbya aestuarii BL J]